MAPEQSPAHHAKAKAERGSSTPSMWRSCMGGAWDRFTRVARASFGVAPDRRRLEPVGGRRRSLVRVLTSAGIRSADWRHAEHGVHTRCLDRRGSAGRRGAPRARSAGARGVRGSGAPARGGQQGGRPSAPSPFRGVCTRDVRAAGRAAAAARDGGGVRHQLRRCARVPGRARGRSGAGSPGRAGGGARSGSRVPGRVAAGRACRARARARRPTAAGRAWRGPRHGTELARRASGAAGRRGRRRRSPRATSGSPRRARSSSPRSGQPVACGRPRR